MKYMKESESVIYTVKMVPWGQKSERRLSTMSHDDFKADWNRRTDRQTEGRTDRTTY